MHRKVHAGFGPADGGQAPSRNWRQAPHLTGIGYSGGLGYSIKARALDTRLGRSESQLPQQYICQVAYSGNGLGRADDNSPHTQEPCASKDARTDLEQRRERRRSRRL